MTIVKLKPGSPTRRQTTTITDKMERKESRLTERKESPRRGNTVTDQKESPRAALAQQKTMPLSQGGGREQNLQR
jgi:hypothetical protein